MERVEGLSGGRFVFLHLDFIYLLSHIGDVLTHVKCQVGGCQGSAAFSGDNVYPIREHNHGPDLEMLDLIRFKNELRRLARESSEDYRRLYDNASARFRLGARAYAFPAASQMMQRIRRAHVPPTPTDLLNLQETLRHPNWTNWAKDSEGNDFFRESFVAPDGTQCAVFVSHTFSDLVVRPGWRAHADGTFKSIPLNLNLEQLFSLHVIDEDNHGQKKQLYPVAYALMTRRTTDAYEAVLRCICNHVPGIQRPASLMADFEPALRSGFRRVWPEIEVHGCWFHFGQAVLHRAVDECHLKPLLQEAPEAARAQKMLMTLPLLPMELIVAGLEYVENHVARNGLTPQFAALLRYMRTYWINEVGVEILAIGHLHFRTNNAVEAFHKCLNTSVGVHPNFWKFVDALRAVDNSRARDRGQVQNFVQVRRRQRANYRMQDDHIRDSRALYLEGEQPDIGGFLRAACHSMDRYFYRMMLDNRERAGGPAAAPARAAGAAAAPAGAAGPAPAAGPAAEPADAPGAARVPQGPAPGPARGELLPAGPRPRVARGGRRGVARVAAPAAPAAPAVAAAAPAPLAEDSSDDDDFVQPRQRNQARVAHPAGQPADLPAGQPAQPAGQPAQPAGQPAQPAGQPAQPDGQPAHLVEEEEDVPLAVLQRRQRDGEALAEFGQWLLTEIGPEPEAGVLVAFRFPDGRERRRFAPDKDCRVLHQFALSVALGMPEFSNTFELVIPPADTVPNRGRSVGDVLGVGAPVLLHVRQTPEVDCSVCFDEMTGLFKGRIEPCGHEFCMTCATRLKQEGSRCAFCRGLIVGEIKAWPL